MMIVTTGGMNHPPLTAVDRVLAREERVGERHADDQAQRHADDGEDGDDRRHRGGGEQFRADDGGHDGQDEQARGHGRVHRTHDRVAQVGAGGVGVRHPAHRVGHRQHDAERVSKDSDSNPDAVGHAAQGGHIPGVVVRGDCDDCGAHDRGEPARVQGTQPRLGWREPDGKVGRETDGGGRVRRETDGGCRLWRRGGGGHVRVSFQ